MKNGAFTMKLYMLSINEEKWTTVRFAPNKESRLT